MLRSFLLTLLCSVALVDGADKALELGFSGEKEAVLTQAAAEGRHVLAFFTTDW